MKISIQLQYKPSQQGLEFIAFKSKARKTKKKGRGAMKGVCFLSLLVWIGSNCRLQTLHIIFIFFFSYKKFDKPSIKN